MRHRFAFRLKAGSTGLNTDILHARTWCEHFPIWHRFGRFFLGLKRAFYIDYISQYTYWLVQFPI